MKQLFNILLISLFAFNALGQTSPNPVETNSQEKKSEVVYLTDQTFKEKIFNYTLNKNWKFEGSKPCIVDFYADWCGPCRRVSPILEEIAKQFAGQIIVYKVNTDKEQILSTSLGIQSLPTVLFVPVLGQPQAIVGAYPKDDLIKIVNEFLLGKK
jgi:thioredoxin 1